MKTKFWTICIQKAQYLTKTSGIPLFMQGLDGEVFGKHPTRHLTKHLTILGTPPSLPKGEEPQVAHVGGDASLRRNST